jgi:hypothetical protein
VSSAGEALPADIGERFKAHFGVDIVDGIGSTEMLHIFLSNRPGRCAMAPPAGRCPATTSNCAAKTAARCPTARPATCTSTARAALMYWGNRAKSRETFQGGWTKSGDKYVRNADGSYTYSGRSDDMLKVSGIYVSPFEVEATLVQHPAVLEAAVIGVPDAEGLTKTKAFVVLKAGAATDEDELKAFVKERLAPYKYPRLIEFVADLPKTATGKIQRFKLREREEFGVTPAAEILARQHDLGRVDGGGALLAGVVTLPIGEPCLGIRILPADGVPISDMQRQGHHLVQAESLALQSLQPAIGGRATAAAFRSEQFQQGHGVFGASGFAGHGGARSHVRCTTAGAGAIGFGRGDAAGQQGGRHNADPLGGSGAKQAAGGHGGLRDALISAPASSWRGPS